MLCVTVSITWLAIFSILITNDTKFSSAISLQSRLCEAMNMPCGTTNKDECEMIYFKLNSTECRNVVFVKSDPSDNDFGKIRIESYQYNMLSYKQTGFNLTFSNISWSNLKFRFKQEGNEMKNTCRQFQMSSNSTVKNLFYDCLWSNETYEGKTFSFEYEANKNDLISYHKYLFRVPYAKNIDESTELINWEIFIFVELIKNPLGLTTFVLHWQPLPSKFSIDTYNISVYSNNKFGQPEMVYFSNISCITIEECAYYYNAWYGSVQFGVQPICRNTSNCSVTKTITFHLDGENAQSLLIGIVSVTLVIPALVYILFLIRNYFAEKSKDCMFSVPKLLIIFTPSISSHVNVVLALTEYLKMHCNIEPLLDELHIFHSESRDPYKWCNEAFKSADSVMVVASPYHKSLRLGDSVYKNTDKLLLRLLKEQLPQKGGDTKFFVLMLPYSTENDVPIEAVNLRRFIFPKDLNKMLRFIHNDRYFVSYPRSKIQGGKDTYKLLGTKVHSSIVETQINLKKNKSEYNRLTLENKEERDLTSTKPLLPSPRCSKKAVEFVSKEKDKRVMELAENIFSEFPGRLDDMNLSGEESVNLVESLEWTTRNEVVNLDVLDL